MCPLEILEETSDPLLKLSEVWGNRVNTFSAWTSETHNLILNLIYLLSERH